MTMKSHILSLTLAGAVAAASATVAMAQETGATDHQNPVTDPERPNSGPGVQGAPDTRTGPATRTPGGETVEDKSGDGSATTQPSQDSSGVQGPADTRTGPSTRAPGDDGAK